MSKIINNRICVKSIISCCMIASLGMIILSACSDDDNLTKLDSPTVKVVNSSTSANVLNFSWAKVDGAVQYSYVLSSDNEEDVQSGVINVTEVLFSNLKPNTGYTLTVKALAPIYSGNKEPSSEEVEIKATTSPITLDSRTNHATGFFTWDGFTDVESYTFDVIKDGKVIATDTVSAEEGHYSADLTGNYQMSLTSYTNNDGEEVDLSNLKTSFSISEADTLWVVSGKGNNYGLEGESDATLIAFPDGTYSIKGWYGVEGYDLDFSVLKGDSLIIDNGTKSGNWIKIPTGVTNITTELYPKESSNTTGTTYHSFAYLKDYETLTPTLSENGGMIKIFGRVKNGNTIITNSLSAEEKFYIFKW